MNLALRKREKKAYYTLYFCFNANATNTSNRVINGQRWKEQDILGKWKQLGKTKVTMATDNEAFISMPIMAYVLHAQLNPTTTDKCTNSTASSTRKR